MNVKQEENKLEAGTRLFAERPSERFIEAFEAQKALERVRLRLGTSPDRLSNYH